MSDACARCAELERERDEARARHATEYNELYERAHRAERERDEARARLAQTEMTLWTMRERAERAEAACAAMRAALEHAASEARMLNRVEQNGPVFNALATDAGRSLVERVERYERALRWYADRTRWRPAGDDACVLDPRMCGEAACDGWEPARAALDGGRDV
jgi:hypothetical protein